MTSLAYYNEFDPYAAAWLRNLIEAGAIAPGDVDERDIRDVRPEDLDGYDQCHFFAGIGGWSYALRLSQWPDDRPVWTGSCPCQPLSSAGQRKGHDDERHLWPAFHDLIAECRPSTVFGEQVASKDGREWFAGVRADLEDLGYACGGADMCAAGVGAPNIRQRLWWVANAERRPTERYRHKMDATPGSMQTTARQQRIRSDTGDGRTTGRLDYTTKTRRTGAGQRGADTAPRDETRVLEPTGSSASGGLGDSSPPRRQGGECRELRDAGRRQEGGAAAESGATSYRLVNPTSEQVGVPRRARQQRTADFWSDFDVIPCADGKARRVESGTFPLVDGLPVDMGRDGADQDYRQGQAPYRIGMLRGYGNAINPVVAAEFIMAYEEAKT